LAEISRGWRAVVAMFMVNGLFFGLWDAALVPTLWVLVPAVFFFRVMHGAMDVTMNGRAGEAEKRGGGPMMSVFHAMRSVGAGLGEATGCVATKASAGR